MPATETPAKTPRSIEPVLAATRVPAAHQKAKSKKHQHARDLERRSANANEQSILDGDVCRLDCSRHEAPNDSRSQEFLLIDTRFTQ
jgi:hypothetical protein